MDTLGDVWVSRDYPVLREVTRLIDQGAGLVNTSDVAATLRMTEEASGLALAALERRGLVSDLVEVGVGYRSACARSVAPPTCSPASIQTGTTPCPAS